MKALELTLILVLSFVVFLGIVVYIAWHPRHYEYSIEQNIGGKLIAVTDEHADIHSTRFNTEIQYFDSKGNLQIDWSQYMMKERYLFPESQIAETDSYYLIPFENYEIASILLFDKYTGSTERIPFKRSALLFDSIYIHSGIPIPNYVDFQSRITSNSNENTSVRYKYNDTLEQEVIFTLDFKFDENLKEYKSYNIRKE